MMTLSNFPAPNVGVQHKQDNTRAFIDGNDVGTGSLYIAESQVSWQSSSGEGFNLEYPKICLHAISRDVTSFPHECLYLQIDGKLIENDQDSSSDEENDPLPPTTEVRFVPSNTDDLNVMFSTMSDCQTLHPDPEDEGSDVEDGQFYEGEEDADELTAEGQVTLQRLENMLQAGQGDAPPPVNTNGNAEDMENEDHGQFEDADMEQ